MTKNQKPLRKLKRDTRRVVNDALASLRDVAEELNKEPGAPWELWFRVDGAVKDLEAAKEYGAPWWKNS